jgi:YD repeat-containing protein
MAIPIVSDQRFTAGARIIGLPPAVADGQPVVYEQLSAITSISAESAVLTFPYDQAGRSLSQTITRPGTLPTQSCQCWFDSTTEDDENEVEMLENVYLMANCSLNAVTFYINSPDIESGVFKIKYRIV